MSLMNQVFKNYKKNNSEDDFNGNGYLKKEKKNFVNGSNGENIVLDSVLDRFNEEEINLKNNTKCCKVIKVFFDILCVLGFLSFWIFLLFFGIDFFCFYCFFLRLIKTKNLKKINWKISLKYNYY